MTLKILRGNLLSLIIILSIISFTARSQKVVMGIQSSLNHSFIPDVEKKPFRNKPPLNSGYSVSIYEPGITETYKEKIGGKINLNIDINLSTQLFLRTGIGFSLQRFKRKVVNEEQEALYLGNWTMKEGPPKDPGTKSGNFVPDHQPPIKVSQEAAKWLYPQCIGCSRTQGGEVRTFTKGPYYK